MKRSGLSIHTIFITTFLNITISPISFYTILQNIIYYVYVLTTYILMTNLFSMLPPKYNYGVLNKPKSIYIMLLFASYLN